VEITDLLKAAKFQSLQALLAEGIVEAGL